MNKIADTWKRLYLTIPWFANRFGNAFLKLQWRLLWVSNKRRSD